MKLVLYFLLFIFVKFAHSARILGVFFFPSYSHHVVYEPLYRELSRRGHEMVVITTNPLRDPTLTNLTEIDISYLYKPASAIASLKSIDYRHFACNLGAYGEVLVEELLKNKEVQKMLNDEGEHFDLVIVEDYYPALYAFGAKYRTPIIGMTSTEAILSSHTAIGNPIHPVLYGDFVLDYSEPLSIFKKIQYVYNFLWFKHWYKSVLLRKSNDMVKKYFGGNMPSVEVAAKNLSMLFVNTNTFMGPIRPLALAVISTGFIHVKEPKPLPPDLQKVLNDSTQGAIYFSLGSNVKSANLPPVLQRIIIKALSELPYTVLWKWEADQVAGAAENVVTRKWFPQQDVLAHPNLKAFVTQGGLQSAEEAILRGVPMVALPFASEQHKNAKVLQKLGIAIYIEPMEMTKNALKQAIIEVAENVKYNKKIHELKAIVEDQPMTSLEKAVWWTEYVIRHKGARHLRSVLADTPLYEYLMLDVIGLVLGSLIIGLIVVYAGLKLVYRRLANFDKYKIS